MPGAISGDTLSGVMMWIVMGAVLVALAFAGSVYQRVGCARDRRTILPPGRMVAVGTHRLHVVEAGPSFGGEEENSKSLLKPTSGLSGAPESIHSTFSTTATVVFEAALGASSISWSLVQPEVAKVARTIAYDRAGMGFSESGPEPRTAERIVEEMHAVLEAAGAVKPYVLVGHSYGGMTCRLFAARYPAEVAGMVLLDPPDTETWRNPSREQHWKLRAGAMLARRGALVAELGIARLTAALAKRGARRLAKATAAVVSGGLLIGRRSERLVAPMERIPAELRPMMASAWIQSKYYRSLASQIQHMPESAAQVAGTSVRRDMPLIVLSAASMSKDEMQRDRELARMSSRSRHEIVEGSGHWIPLDRPDVVVGAVREVLEEVASSE